jgi:hypothetical protein
MNGTNLLNQHQLAAKLRRSRAAIIHWEREGMPVAKRGGPGRPTLYDLAEVSAWINRTGRGLHRPAQAPMQLAQVSRAANPQISEGERLLGRVLEEGLGGIVALFLVHGVPGDAALSAFDTLVVAAYSVLEQHTGRDDPLIPMNGALRLLMDDAGRAQILEHAQHVASGISREELLREPVSSH